MPTLFTLKDHFKENKLYLNRTIISISLISILIIILIGRLAFLQIYKHDVYLTLARNNQIKIVPITPVRGLIYDKNGVLLAENIPTFNLEIIPNNSKNIKETISTLSSILPITEDEINLFKKQLKFKGVHESIPIKRKLTDKEVAKFSVVKYKFPEIEITASLSRHYPHKQIFSHALGYVGPLSEEDLKKVDLSQYRGINQIGKSGIEQSYEETLKGQSGFQQVETDAKGKIIRVLDTTPPIAGKNLYLSIDGKLQIKAYNTLGSNNGAIIALNNKTGKVLAFVSKPGYDSNLFIRGIDHKTYNSLKNSPFQPLFNRAIKGQYPPGSIIKPIIAIQALEHKIIDPNVNFHDVGYYQLKNDSHIFRELKALNGHGFINLEKAIAVSCTTFFYYLADKLGIDRIHDIYNKFGLGQATNIDILGEANGLAPSQSWKRKVMHSAWYPGETLSVGIGQGYTLVTPLQIVQMTSTIANKGTAIQPSLVQSIQNKSVETASVVKNKINLINNKNWDIVIKGMEQVISNPIGTAHRIYKNDALRIAGKTGTAQVFGRKNDDEYIYDNTKIKSTLRDHAWFTAFAPIEDPQIAIVVLMEHGSGGSSSIARVILDEYFKGNKK